MLIRLKLLFIATAMLLSISGYASANDTKNDSLIELINSTSVDTIKIDAFLELAKITQTNKPDQSVDITINALEIAKNIMSDRHIAKSYNQLGISYYHKGELIQAKNFINNSYLIYKQLNNKKGIASTLNGLGVLNFDQGELNEALENFHQSLTVNKQINNLYGIAMTLNNIGNVYKDLGEYDKAIEYYNKSLESKKINYDKQGIAMSLNNIGLVYHELKEYDKALDSHQRSLKLKREVNDRHGEAMSLHNIGWLYQTQANTVQALKFYQQALDLREIIGDGFGASMTLGNMSEAHVQLENYDKAIFYLNISLMKAEQINAKKILKNIYLQLSKTQVLAQDFENAYQNQKKYIELTDSLMGDDNYKELAVLKAEMEAKNSDNDVTLLLKEREIQSLKNKRQEIISYSLAGGLILIIVLAIVLYLRNGDKLKQLALQEHLNEISKLTDSYAVVSDIDDKIVWANDGFTQIMGYTLEEVIGKRPADFMRGEDTDTKTVEFIENKLKAKEPFNIEILNYKKDGTPIWLTISATVVKNENNEVDRYVSFGSDISRRKNAEKEMQRILS